MFQQWKIVTMKKTLGPLGGELQQEMLCPFLYEHEVYYFHRWLALQRNPLSFPVHQQRRKAKSVYGNTPVLWSGVHLSILIFLGITLRLQATHIAKSASRTQTRTRCSLLSMKYVPLKKVMRTKWWPATGEQRMFKWQYLRNITTCSCTAVRGIPHGEIRIDTNRK
jgi:hypothetical protein